MVIMFFLLIVEHSNCYLVLTRAQMVKITIANVATYVSFPTQFDF